MFIFFLILIVITFFGVKINNKNIFVDNMNVEKTNAVKGIFTLLIIISHSVYYNNMYDLFGNVFDHTYAVINKNIIGQSCVVMFLFYSGYGIMYSIKNKGSDYVKRIPANRCLKLIVNFSVFSCVFFLVIIILSYILNNHSYKLSVFFNDNWYIFVILFLYFITYISFTVFKNQKYSIALLIFLSGVLVFILSRFLYEFWYDTIFAYSCGAIYYIYEKKVIRFLSKNSHYYLSLTVFSLLLVLSLVLYYRVAPIYILLELKHFFFLVTFVLLTFKVSFNNSLLQFCGKHLFSIYIIQRLPMCVLHMFMVDKYPFVFVVITIASTLLLCVPFDTIIKRLDNKLFIAKPSRKTN